MSETQVYLSFVKVRKDALSLGGNDGKRMDPAPLGRFNVKNLDLQLPEGEFVLVGTKSYDNEFIATQHLEQLSKKVRESDEKTLFLHAKKDLHQEKSVQMITLVKNQGISYKTILNPLWRGLKGVHRNVASVFLQPDCSLALQSQLFAMLDTDRADLKWSSSFKLKDIQVDEVYAWQTKYLPSGNLITVERMILLMKNVLNVTRLPWIKLNLVDSGKACMFVVEFDTSETSSDVSSFSWLNESTESTWEMMGHYDKIPKLKIESMSLTFVTTWGLNPYILLHELAHYITFCLPVNSKLNKGIRRLSFKEYELMFSGHGVLYMGVFRYLLIVFGGVVPAFLDKSLNAAKVKYININKFSTDDIERNIIDYVDSEQLRSRKK